MYEATTAVSYARHQKSPLDNHLGIQKLKQGLTPFRNCRWQSRVSLLDECDQIVPRQKKELSDSSLTDSDISSIESLSSEELSIPDVRPQLVNDHPIQIGNNLPLLRLNLPLSDSSFGDDSSESLIIEDPGLSVLSTAHKTSNTNKSPYIINYDFFKLYVAEANLQSEL